MKKILIITAVMFLSSCKFFTEASTPYSMGTGFKVPAGTPVFQQGYKDGCSEIMYARGNGFYRWRHSYRYDPRLRRNNEYNLGFRRGVSFCFNFTVPGISSPDRMLFPFFSGRGANNANNFLAKSYDKTGLFEGGLDAPITTWGTDGINSAFQVFGGTSGNSAFGANPLWAGGSAGQFFGQ